MEVLKDMEQYKQEFIEFMVQSDVLKFGEFTLKSGRKSPFELYGKDVRYCSNRKEVKDHGDAGILLGSPIKDGDRVMIIEDVTTSGKSIEETFPIIKAQGDVEIKGLIVSLNRMERGKGEKSALEEIRDLYGFPTAAIVTMKDVTEHLYNRECGGRIVIDDTIKKALDAYYEEYGAK